MALINISFCPAVSSLVFFVVVVVLLSVIYRKDPQCCKFRSYQGQNADMVSSSKVPFILSFPQGVVERGERTCSNIRKCQNQFAWLREKG